MFRPKMFIILALTYRSVGFLSGSDSKETARNTGDQVLSLGQEDSPGECKGSPHQYSCLENSVERGVWQGIVHGVAKSQTQLNN